jgi:hypothetical protein
MTDLVTRQLQVTLLDPFGTPVESQVFDVTTPLGGSKDEDTDDHAAGEAVAKFVSSFAGAMTRGGLAFTIETTFVDEKGPDRGAYIDSGQAVDRATGA